MSECSIYNLICIEIRLKLKLSDRRVLRPAFSSTSWEVCQKNIYGVMVVPMTAVMT